MIELDALRYRWPGAAQDCLAIDALRVDAGRTLFQASRERRGSVNDSDRLRKYLARFGLEFAAMRSAAM